MRESLIAGQYSLIEQIGRGGFAVVWRARDDRLRRDVAAKQLFLPPHFTEEQRREHRERTFREARAAARLAHPGVVTVHDVVEHDGMPWIIMEFVPGRTLSQIVRMEGPLAPARAARIGLRVLDALRAAHALGVLHRDVKPSNVIVGDDRVVLGDFGIARTEGGGEDEITGTGIVMGAPSYTAPERARGEPAVAASDLWSLGATLFYAVEGRRAFCGPNANATFHAILTGDRAPARRLGPLRTVVDGLMRMDPGDRMTGEEAAELLAEAARAGERVSPAAPPRRARATGRKRRRREKPREPARHGTAAVPPPRPASGPQRPLAPGAVATRRAPARGTRSARPRRRPVVTVASLTTLTLLLLGNGLRVDDPRRRPTASYRTPVPHPRLTATLPTGGGEVLGVAFSPDGHTLAATGQDRDVRLWNTATGLPSAVPSATLSGHGHPVSTAVFSPDGRTLATGGYDGRVTLWNTGTRRAYATLNTHGRGHGTLSFSPDGAVLATSGDAVRLWDLRTRHATRSLPDSGENLLNAAFAPHGRILATAGSRAVRLWDVSARPRPTTVAKLTSLVGGMAFSPDGRTLATGGDDRVVRLWDVRAHRLAATVSRFAGRVNAVAFSPDGRTLACASDETVLLWNIRSRTVATLLDARTRTVEAIAFSPDGRTLATAGDDAAVRLWDLR
jgi:serine/threonine protein kinase/sugar lactone lactonase YvrE